MPSNSLRSWILVSGCAFVLVCAAACAPRSSSPAPSASATSMVPTPAGGFATANAQGAFVVPTVSQSPIPGTGAFNPAGGPPVGQDAQVAGVAADQLTIQLTPANDSGLTGSATLSEPVNGQTHVILLVKGTNGAQAADIEQGHCPTPDHQAKWNLSAVTDGTSVTDLSARLQTITQGVTAIVVHRSAEDPTVVACGDIQQGP